MAAPRRLRLPVPTTIVTGALASGKTSLIAALLRSKPPGEEWAVLVNEFGAAGLDGALLEGEHQQGGGGGVRVRQLAGGCLCCALSNMTPLAIAQLLRAVKPDRLLIEPSGLAHPAALVDMLTGGHLGSSLALQPVVCLVDASQFCGGAAVPVACEASQLLMDQISIADVLVGSKADLCNEATLAAFHRWAGRLFPAKARVVAVAAGRLDGAAAAALLRWADGEARGGSSGSSSPSRAGSASQPAPQGLQAQQAPVQRVRRTAASSPWFSSTGPAEAEATADQAACTDQPLRKQVSDASGDYSACGWIYHRDCTFSRPALLALLAQLVPCTLRVKGVFRVSPRQWVAVSAAPPPATAGAVAAGEGSGSGGSGGSAAAGAAAASEAVELREIAYRRDSRVEIILDTKATAAAAAAAAAATAAAAVAASAGGAPAAGSAAAPASDSLEVRAAAVSLAQAAGASREALKQQVVAALGSAAAGEWSALEALLLATLVEA
ncbi:cobalamin biosynthesis [Micractinium conductrix]|uniref:Cobalamin biosynthesis n=1 Tax=Micractinium conductrix TaxID=554055 RepID=A0A2P6V9L4_9CHLO|nr:cobalamin biosynthesis [Micractinium conductrix]|eukprot:PSC70787.1 cobalamin biosynthesis [Micractinium conductrix]